MIAIRQTTEADLALVEAAESDPDTRRWLGDTGAAWHRAALTDPDQEHLALTSDGQIVAFAVVAGLRNPHSSVELRRILTVPAHRGRGHGRAALTAVVDRAFVMHDAHRLWLDVKSGNTRARRLYRSAGFVEEGRLRDALREADDSFSSLVVMSMLSTER